MPPKNQDRGPRRQRKVPDDLPNFRRCQAMSGAGCHVLQAKAQGRPDVALWRHRCTVPLPPSPLTARH